MFFSRLELRSYRHIYTDRDRVVSGGFKWEGGRGHEGPALPTLIPHFFVFMHFLAKHLPNNRFAHTPMGTYRSLALDYIRANRI